MMSLIVIAIVLKVTYQLIITTACSSLSLTDCNASGYCILISSTCTDLPCYKINEVAACRDPTSIAYTTTSGACQALPAIDLRYDNVCGTNGQLDYTYIRLPIDKSGSPIYSTTGMTITEVNAENNAAKRNNLLNQLFSFNIQTATNTQLIAILGLYVAYKNDIIGQTGYAMSHPYYLEKAIFQALQNLRDDTDASKDQTTTLTKIWNIADILLIRLRTYRKHYATSYFFINFAHTLFSRTYLSVKGQFSVFSLKWTQYSLNGYVQIITFSLKQFSGFSNAISDGIMITTTSTDTNPYSLTYTLVWLITDTSKITCPINTSSYLHIIDDKNAMTEITSIDIHTYCFSSTHRCDIPSSVITGGQAYYIACVA